MRNLYIRRMTLSAASLVIRVFHLLAVALMAFFGLGCKNPQPMVVRVPGTHPASPPNSEWAKKFSDAGIIGTLAIYDVGTDNWEFHNQSRADSAFLPASTFKVFNSLMALELGAVLNADEVLHWDGSNPSRPACNQDINMWDAFRASCVWYYQEIARRIGPKRMEKWLKRVGYGNTLTGPKIDEFWLRGDLRISAKQQVEFLKRLMFLELPFKDSVQLKVKDIMMEEDGKDWRFYGKTGWGEQDGRQIGWFVGFIEAGMTKKVFAMNMDIVKDEDAGLRRQIVREIFKEQGLMPGAE